MTVLIALLKTYLDIVALRKSPADLPSSSLVLAVSVILVGSTFALQFLLFSTPSASIMNVLYGYAAELSVYLSTATLAGFSQRLRQMLSAIIGCGALIALLSVAVRILALPLVGGVAANALAVLTFFWAVPVKGHIMARTLDRHWFIGIAVAMLAFVVRFSVESILVVIQQGGGS